MVILYDLCRKNGADIKEIEYKFDEGFIILEEEKIFIEKIIGVFGMLQAEEHININAFDSIGLILKDIITKELKIFNKQNKFLKNIQE